MNADREGSRGGYDFLFFYTVLLLHFRFVLFILLNSTCFCSLVEVLVNFISRDRISVCTALEHGTIRATNR